MKKSLQRAFAKHRKALSELLSDGLIFAAGGVPLTRNHDVEYVFRQKSDFLWLTGVEAPGYALAIDPKRGREVLFIPRIDQTHKVWLGHVPDAAETRRLFGVGDVRYMDELDEVLPKMKGRLKKLYTDNEGAKLAKTAGIKLKKDSAEYADALAHLRLVKDEAELELMERANEVSSAAHEAAMRATRPGMYEYQVQAVLEAAFRAQGMKHNAYNSIVAAGKNGAVLHYHHNSDPVRAGQLMLIDAGAENMGYGADITRTFPVDGNFTPRQRDVYEVVLTAQERSIDRMRAGTPVSDVHRISQEVLAEGLKDLGLLRGSIDELVNEEAVRVFYPHGIGHPLGLDVHDVDGGKRHRLKGPKPKNLRANYRLPAGAVMTVEPGVYFIEALIKDPEVRARHGKRVAWTKAERFLSLGGVRIEDNVIIQPEGPPRNLTTAPKAVKDVEAACARP